MQKRLSAKIALATGTAMRMIVRDVLPFPAETRTLRALRITKVLKTQTNFEHEQLLSLQQMNK